MSRTAVHGAEGSLQNADQSQPRRRARRKWIGLGVGVVVLALGAGSAAHADDDESIPVTINITDTVPQLLTLTYTKELSQGHQQIGFRLLDGAVGAAGAPIAGLLGKITVTDARESATGWDLTTTVQPFINAATQTQIPVGSVGTIATYWDPDAAPYSGILGSESMNTSPGPRALLSATPEAGLGSFDFNVAVEVDVPASAPLGSYSSTFTVDLVGG